MGREPGKCRAVNPHLLLSGWHSRGPIIACLGYTASALVLATFSVRSMRALRCIGILSNIAFISYAVAAGLAPILILHLVLLPTNVFRLLQLERAGRSLETSACIPAHRLTRGFAGQGRDVGQWHGG